VGRPIATATAARALKKSFVSPPPHSPRAHVALCGGASTPKHTSLGVSGTQRGSSGRSHSSSRCRRTLAGLAFLLTGLEASVDGAAAYSAESISRMIRALAGTLLDDEKQLFDQGTGRRRPDTFLIASPSAFRRPKFLTALSIDLPILHPQWVLDAATSPSPPPPADYLVAAGSSPLHPYFVFRESSSSSNAVCMCLCLCSRMYDVCTHVLASLSMKNCDFA
jgi:hypothetical protein